MLLELVGSIVHCRSSGVALMNAIREDWDPRRITTPLVAVVRSVAKAGSMRMVDLWEELDLRPPPVTTFSVIRLTIGSFFFFFNAKLVEHQAQSHRWA